MLKALGKIALLLLLAAAVAGGLAVREYRAFIDRPMNVPAEGYVLDVPAGSSLARVASQLEAAGVIDQALLLRAYGRLSGQAARIKAGEYALAAGTTPRQLLEKLVAGEVVQYTLTLVEGWTFKQLMQAVRAHPALTQTLTGLSGEEIMARLGSPGVHPEGQFYPDTYRFPRGTTDLDFLRRAHELMKRRLAAEWDQRSEGLPLKTPYEALILASIIERETGVPEERPRIAGVFVRRLKLGMRLQTDPTVIYGVGDAFDGNLRRRDLLTDTPYNTYTRAGLPPTPIAMPSAAAINAALNPAPGNELYFVSKGDGSHYFSATLEEHNAAVRRYQLKGR